MTSYGIKVSQPGFDVGAASDFEQVFASKAPLLKIHSKGSFSLADASLDQDIATHNLGYYPLVWVFLTDAGFYWSSGQSRIDEANVAMVSTSKLRWMGSYTGQSPTARTGYYYIFRQDVTASFTASTDSLTTTSPASSANFGLKVSIPGKSVTSTDYRDYAVHSDARSPQVYMTGTVTGASNIITHNLGYIPLYFILLKVVTGGVTYYQPLTSSQDAVVSADITTLSFGVGVSATFAYVILLDPFAIDS